MVWFFLAAGLLAVWQLYVSAGTTLGVGRQVDYFQGIEAGPPDRRGGSGFAGSLTAIFGVWAIFLLPEMIRTGGLAAAFLAVAAVPVFFIGLTLAKPMWRAARVAGTSYPAGILLGMEGHRAAGRITAGLSLLAALVVLALVFKLAGLFVDGLTAGRVNADLASLVFAFILSLTVIPAGFGVARRLGPVHAVLALAGFLAAGMVMLGRLDGPSGLSAVFHSLAVHPAWPGSAGRGGGDYSLALAVAGIFEISPGGHGGRIPWNASSLAASALALLAFQVSLIAPQWDLPRTDPRRYWRYQAWLGPALGGGLVLAGALVLGAGGIRLAPPGPSAIGADPLTAGFLAPGLGGWLNGLVPDGGLTGVAVAIGGLAILQCFALSLLAVASAAFRVFPRSEPGRADGKLIVSARLVGLAIIVVALMAALARSRTVAELGELGLAMGALTLVSLLTAAGVLRPSRGGLQAGLVLGFAAILATSRLAWRLASDLGIEGPTEILNAWPFGLHPAFWGLAVALTAVLLSHRPAGAEAKPAQADGPAAAGRRDQKPLIWILTLTWVFFALGPGMVIGNDIFGRPSAPPETWSFDWPSILVWQISAWISGTVLVWFAVVSLRLTDLDRETVDRFSSAGD